MNTDVELVGGDPPHRLLWGQDPGWVIQREVSQGHWTDVASYDRTPPLARRRFILWLSEHTGLTFDMAEDAYKWLQETHPERFIDPWDEVE